MSENEFTQKVALQTKGVLQNFHTLPWQTLNLIHLFTSLKKHDSSLLAQFYYADEELNAVATELDSFDGRKDPERCASLVYQLRQCQDKVGFVNSVFDSDIYLCGVHF